MVTVLGTGTGGPRVREKSCELRSTQCAVSTRVGNVWLLSLPASRPPSVKRGLLSI